MSTKENKKDKEIEREYATLGFSDGDEVVIPGILELLHVGHGTHFGVAVQGAVSPINEEFVSLVEQFKTLVKQIGFVGVFDIDFFIHVMRVMKNIRQFTETMFVP